MSEALPALSFGEINSVIAFFGNPPPMVLSRKDQPVERTDVAEAAGWGKRSASNFRRSITLLLVPTRKYWHKNGICSNEHFSKNEPSLVASQLPLPEGEE